MLNMTVIPFLARATLTVRAPMLLEVEQPGAYLFLLVAVQIVIAPSRWCGQARWNGNGISVECVHLYLLP
jgi:hypothetical protein